MPTRLGSSYSRKRSLGQGNIFTSIYDSFYSRGGGGVGGGGLMSLPVVMVSTPLDSLPKCNSTHTHPWTAHPESTLPGQYTSFLAHPLGSTLPSQQAGGTHPTGILSCFIRIFIPFSTPNTWTVFFFHSG